MPLQRADAKTFKVDDPREGRVDVGLRCISSGLFRSQGLRRNSQVCLEFEMSGHSIEVSGALVRGLRPDDRSMGSRLRASIDAFIEGGGPPDPEEDPVGWSASEFRGIEVRKRGLLKALRAAIRGAALKGEMTAACSPRVAVLILDPDGIPIAKACEGLAQREPLVGIIAIIGDDRGLEPESMQNLATAAESLGAEVIRVSLGSTTLLASHVIVLLHHYLDEMVHRCTNSEPRDYGLGASRRSADVSDQPEGPSKRQCILK